MQADWREWTQALAWPPAIQAGALRARATAAARRSPRRRSQPARAKAVSASSALHTRADAEPRSHRSRGEFHGSLIHPTGGRGAVTRPGTSFASGGVRLGASSSRRESSAVGASLARTVRAPVPTPPRASSRAVQGTGEMLQPAAAAPGREVQRRTERSADQREPDPGPELARGRLAVFARQGGERARELRRKLSERFGVRCRRFGALRGPRALLDAASSAATHGGTPTGACSPLDSWLAPGRFAIETGPEKSASGHPSSRRASR